jgi:hypothetical protein
MIEAFTRGRRRGLGALTGVGHPVELGVAVDPADVRAGLMCHVSNVMEREIALKL